MTRGWIVLLGPFPGHRSQQQALQGDIGYETGNAVCLASAFSIRDRTGCKRLKFTAVGAFGLRPEMMLWGETENRSANSDSER